MAEHPAKCTVGSTCHLATRRADEARTVPPSVACQSWLVGACRRALCDKMNKGKKAAVVKPFMVKNYLSVFINCMIENPAFDSQVTLATSHM